MLETKKPAMAGNLVMLSIINNIGYLAERCHSHLPYNVLILQYFKIEKNRVTTLVTTNLGLKFKIQNGYDILLWIKQEVVLCQFIPPEIIEVHFANPTGRKRMLAAIESIMKIGS